MLTHLRSRMRTLTAIATTLIVTLGLGAAAAPASALQASPNGLWIVQLTSRPLAAAPGAVRHGRCHHALGPGLPRPARRRAGRGRRAAQRAARPPGRGRGQLPQRPQRHRDRGRPGRGCPLIAAVPGVAAVEPDEVYELTTDASHDLIGSAAIWDGETGPELCHPGRGRGRRHPRQRDQPVPPVLRRHRRRRLHAHQPVRRVPRRVRPGASRTTTRSATTSWSGRGASWPGTPPATPTGTAATPPRPPPATGTT